MDSRRNTTMLNNKTSASNHTPNMVIIQWWEDFYEKSKEPEVSPTVMDPSAFLKDVKVVVMLLVGFSGALIVGSLIFCMFHKNERILERLPWTKEYKRRKVEPEAFYPIPGLGSFKSSQTLSLLAMKSKLPGGLLTPKGIKPAISGLYSSKDKPEEDRLKATVEDVNEYKSDRSSLHESDAGEEYQAPDNTFPAGGQVEARKKGKKKKREQKRVKRHRKKNQFSTTVITSGAAPGAEEDQGDAQPGQDGPTSHSDVTYMSRF